MLIWRSIYHLNLITYYVNFMENFGTNFIQSVIDKKLHVIFVFKNIMKLPYWEYWGVENEIIMFLINEGSNR